MGKADGGRQSLWLSLSRALVPAIILQQSPDTLVGPAGLAPFQLVEPSPLVQFEPRSAFLPLERIIALHAVLIGVRQVVLPVQEGGIRYGLVGRAVRARLFPASCPPVHVPVVLSHILSLHSIPDLGHGTCSLL